MLVIGTRARRSRIKPGKMSQFIVVYGLLMPAFFINLRHNYELITISSLCLGASVVETEVSKAPEIEHFRIREYYATHR